MNTKRQYQTVWNDIAFSLVPIGEGLCFAKCESLIKFSATQIQPLNSFVKGHKKAKRIKL